MPSIYNGYEFISWADVQPGDTVYIDNYQDGRFPFATPMIGGPYTVKSVTDRRLMNAKSRSFMHYPDNLLKKVTHDAVSPSK